MTLATVSVLLLTLASFDEPKAQPRAKAPRPVAMVLAVKGAVQATPPNEKPRTLAVADLLYADDSIAVPADGSATIAVLGAGLRQTLKGGATVKLGPKGCKTSPMVESRELPRAVASTMKGVRPAPGDARRAGVAARGVEPQRSPPLAPIYGATVDSLRPELAWRAQEGIKSYRVTLTSAAGEVLWRAETSQPKLPPSKDRPALARGGVYDWKVTDPDGRELTSGHFAVADEDEAKTFAELKPLASSKDPADLLAVALAYEGLGGFAEALACYEALDKLTPGVPAYRDALARLRKRTALATAPR
jgi:hypothetical protein